MRGNTLFLNIFEKNNKDESFTLLHRRKRVRMQRMRRAYRPRRVLFEHLLENINVLTLFNLLTQPPSGGFFILFT